MSNDEWKYYEMRTLKRQLEKFDKLAKANNRSRRGQLNMLIDDYIRNHGSKRTGNAR